MAPQQQSVPDFIEELPRNDGEAQVRFVMERPREIPRRETESNGTTSYQAHRLDLRSEGLRQVSPNARAKSLIALEGVRDSIEHFMVDESGATFEGVGGPNRFPKIGNRKRHRDHLVEAWIGTVELYRCRMNLVADPEKSERSEDGAPVSSGLRQVSSTLRTDSERLLSFRASDGNRTRATSLGSWSSAIELHSRAGAGAPTIRF